MSIATKNPGGVNTADGARRRSWGFLGSPACKTMAIAALILVAIVGNAIVQTGDSKLAWPWLMGQRLLCRPTRIERGTVEAKKWIETEVHVINLSNKQKTILGSQKSCGCIGVGVFPVEIPANSTHTLRIRYSTLNKPGAFEHFVKYFSDDSMCRVIQISLYGKVE